MAYTFKASPCSRSYQTAYTAWQDLKPGESVREHIAANYGRRINGGGEIITLMHRVVDHVRSDASWRADRGYRAATGRLNVGESHETVKLTPQTEIQISAFYWRMPPGLTNRRRLYFSLNGRRCSRETAMAAARSAWEGEYAWERGIGL